MIRNAVNWLHLAPPCFPKTLRLREVISAPRRWWLAALVSAVVILAPVPTSTSTPTERHFRVEAGDFAYAPASLRVNPGDRVTINLVATDVVHGLYVDGYGLSVSADPGQTARLTFVADRPGTFRFRCSVTCGPLHPFMIGQLNVGPNWLFWRAAGLAALVVFAAVFDRRVRRERGEPDSTSPTLLSSR